MNGHGVPRNSSTAVATTAQDMNHPVQKPDSGRLWRIDENHHVYRCLSMFIHFGPGKHLKIASVCGISWDKDIHAARNLAGKAKAECADLSGADLRNAKLSGFSDVVEIEICGTGWSCGGLPVAAWFVIENP